MKPQSVFFCVFVWFAPIIGGYESLQPIFPITDQMEAAKSDPSSRTVFISVHNKNGSPPDLSPSDFDVKLDGKSVAVREVQRNPAMRYCLLLDISGSTRLTKNRQHEEAVALLSKIPRADRDYGLLVSFNSQAYLDAEGSDPQKLIKNIHQEARSSTAVYDAMIACSDYLSKKGSPRDGPATLRVMFVLSDGVDNSSRFSRGDVQRTLLEGGIRVYSIGEGGAPTFSPDQFAKASKSLKQLDESTGGKEFLLNKKTTIDQIVQTISDDLNNLYAVTLNFEGTAPDTHKLEVRCRKTECVLANRRD